MQAGQGKKIFLEGGGYTIEAPQLGSTVEVKHNQGNTRL